MVIEKAEVYRLHVPLQRPYRIATAEMKVFDSVIVVLHAAGRDGLGEAMAGVQGYFWETPDEVWQFAREKAGMLIGKSFSQAHQYISAFTKRQPCAVTPFLAAIETLSGSFALSPPSAPASTPMLAILQANDEEGIRREISAFLTGGYSTVKVKVGFDADQDIARVRIAQEALQGKAHLRADANQGYTFPQAAKFVKNVDPQNLEFLEQPFRENEWEAMEELAKISPIPLGLDESIYGIESVEKARRLRCAQFVKFKLMKIGSAEALLGLMAKTREYGFGVILGNGAAGEINCYHEALVAGKAGIRAGEMNGFLKQKESILRQGLKMERGNILLPPDFQPRLDRGQVEKFALHRMSFD